MKTFIHNRCRIGAIPVGSEATTFRVLAPNAPAVSVVGEYNDWEEKAIEAKPEPRDGLHFSGTIELPSYGMLIFSQETGAETSPSSWGMAA